MTNLWGQLRIWQSSMFDCLFCLFKVKVLMNWGVHYRLEGTPWAKGRLAWGKTIPNHGWIRQHGHRLEGQLCNSKSEKNPTSCLKWSWFNHHLVRRLWIWWMNLYILVEMTNIQLLLQLHWCPRLMFRRTWWKRPWINCWKLKMVETIFFRH